MKWHPEHTGEWPNLEKFLRSDLRSLLAKPSTGTPFFEIARDHSSNGRIKPVAAVTVAIKLGFMWDTEPLIWVDNLKASAIFSKTKKTIVINIRVAKAFEWSPSDQKYRDALEILMMHELLHWVIDRAGGTSEHGPYGDPKDPVYRFERLAYSDHELRNKTLESIS